MIPRKQKRTIDKIVETHTKEVVEISELLVKYSKKDKNKENVLIRRLLEDELKISLNCFLEDL